MIKKTTIREIRQSLGRYLAIMAIIALGVGIFGGLKNTKPSMQETTQQYLNNMEFYDYRLLSTIGFEEKDVDFFHKQDGVENAEGAYSFDILVLDDNANESVLKAHSISENINKIQVVEGRLPENDTECVVDALYFSKDKIGNKIVLSKNNSKDDSDVFKHSEYTIVGTVQSSLYIQFERGNTSLGNGKIGAFMYLLPEGFNSDYYTEVYVKFNEDFELYSHEYDVFLEEKEIVWEKILEERAKERFQEILVDAWSEISEAEEELASEKADALEELEEAKNDLDEAYRELTEAEKEISDGEIEILDGKQEIQDGKKEIEDAKSTIAENEKKLKDAEAELIENEQLLLEEEAKLTDAINKFNASFKDFEKKKQDLLSNEATLVAQRDQIESGLLLLEEEENKLNQTENTINMAILAGYKSESDPDIIAARAEIAAGREVIASKKQEANAGLILVQGYLDDIVAGKAQLSHGESQLKDANAQIQDGQNKLFDARKQLEEGKKEIADGYAELAKAREELKDAEKELSQAQVDIAKGENDIAEAKEELADGWKKYYDGLAEYEDGLNEFETEIRDAEEEIANAKQDINDLEEPSTFVLGRDTNVGYVCFESDSAIVEGIAGIFPAFFFLVAALVCMTTMNRMIEEQRTQIGVLKALGYGEWTIMNKYLFYSGSAAFVGCMGGFFAGTYFLPKIIWFAYKIMYSVAPLEYVFDLPMALLCLLASLLCSMGTTWISCKNELSEVSAQLMRPKAPKAGKRVWLEYIPFVWNRLKFLHKVSIRNIFRYKKRFFMMIIGISGCTALLVVGFGLRDSITAIAGKQYGEIQMYDLNVVFGETLSEEMKQEFKNITEYTAKEYTYAAEISVDFCVEDKSKGVSLIIMEDSDVIDNYISLHTNENEKVPYPEKGEVVICRKLSEIFNLDIGDEVCLQDADMKRIPVIVSGIFENYMMNYVYISAETYKENIGTEPEFKSIFLNLKEDADAYETSATLISMSDVSMVTVNADMQGRFESMMSSLDYIVYTIIICAGALAFIVLYNLTNINITERIREIATIKVLGFNKKETASYVFRENTVLTFIGAILGLFLGNLLHRFVMSKIVVDMVFFDVHIEKQSYLFSFLLTLLFSLLINRLMSGKLEKINMAESLKSVD